MQRIRFLLLIALVPAALHAQRLPLELGVDAGVFRSWFSGNNRSTTQLELPVRAIRLGLPLNARVGLEPAISFVRVATDGASSNTFGLDVGLLIESSESRAAPHLFIRPLVGIQRTATNNASANQTSLGIGAGVRLGATDRISMRYEARYRHLLERNGVDGNVIGLLVGVSVFTR